MKFHRIVLRPGERLEIALTERLPNGYEDGLADVVVTWQDRDAPPGEIANKHRELQVDTMVGRANGRVGPIVVTHR